MAKQILAVGDISKLAQQWITEAGGALDFYIKNEKSLAIIELPQGTKINSGDCRMEYYVKLPGEPERVLYYDLDKNTAMSIIHVESEDGVRVRELPDEM